MHGFQGVDVGQAVRELEERERRFRAVFESALDAIVIFDDQDRILEANFAAAALFGVSPEAFPGRLLDDFSTSLTDSQNLWAEFRSAGRTRGEFQIVRLDGEHRLVETSVTANFVPGQHVSVLRDVTDRRQDERERLRLAERFERLFRTDLVGMAVLNRRTGCVDDCNHKLAEFFGRAAEEIIGRHVTDFESCFVNRDRYQHLLISWASGAPLRGIPIQSARPDGSQRQGLATLETLPDVDGAGIVDVALVVDVTEEHRLEGELRRAQRLEAIGRLAGGIAHDFNNLLAVMSGYADMLEDVVAPHAEARDSLDQIKRAASRAGKLTHGLLAFSRQESFDVRTVDVNDRIRRTVSALQDLIGPQVQVEVRLNAEAPHVKTDGLQLEHVLLQLATNSRDAMSDGGTFAIETSNEHGEVRISVTDTGIGMDPETLDRVFEPFFTTKTPATGIGLGLSTVYGIITQSGGRVTAESEPGQGTSIHIHLPLAEIVDLESAEPEAPVGAVKPILGMETILLVEEEPAVALLIESFLTRLGYRILRVANATEALRTSASYGRRIDLLISGMRISSKSGSYLLDELRLTRPTLPAILISGFSTDGDAAEIANPYTAQLAKPFAMADLAGMARTLLDVEEPRT